MSILRHSAWAAAAAIVLTISRFIFVAIIARHLSIIDFGQYAYGQWMADLVFLVCSMGVAVAIGRYVAEFRHDPALLASFARYLRPFAIGFPWLAAALVPLGVWVSGLVLEPSVIIMLSLLTLGNGLWAMQTAALSGLQRFDLIFLANIAAAVILIGGALLMSLGSKGLGYVFGIMSLAALCAVIVGYSATRRLTYGATGTVEPARLRAIRGYAINIWITALLWSLVWSRGELPVVRAYLGDDGVARYAAVLTLFGGAIQGVMLAVSAVAPHLTMLWGAGRHDEAITTARSIMDFQLLLCSAGALVLICIGPEILLLAFGNKYDQAATPLSFLAVGLLAMAVSCQNHLLQIATDGRFSRNTMLVGLIMLFALAWYLTQFFQLTGAAAARAGTMLFMSGITIFVGAKRWGKYSFSWGNIIVAYGTICITTGGLFLIEDPQVELRIIVLAAGLLGITSLMRDRHGQLLVRALTRFNLSLTNFRKQR